MQLYKNISHVFRFFSTLKGFEILGLYTVEVNKQN